MGDAVYKALCVWGREVVIALEAMHMLFYCSSPLMGQLLLSSSFALLAPVRFF